jgi:hypothetical protein
MKSNTKLSLILLVVVLLFSQSCRKLEEYPLEPQIGFHDFALLIDQQTGTIEKGILMISYQDGDGDIGLTSADTLFPFERGGDFHYNLIVTYFEQQFGIFEEVPLAETFNTRIPPLLPKGQQKAIKGIIEYELVVNNPFSDFDTIQYKVKLIDRALNISNEVTTPPIVRRHSI